MLVVLDHLAIVPIENMYHDWCVVKIHDIQNNEKGCALYFVEYRDDETFDWIEAHKVRRNHRQCRFCRMFVPNNNSEEDRKHERAHEMANEEDEAFFSD